MLTENLSRYNIKVSTTAIEDMDFTDAFTDAVEANQVAEQKKKQANINGWTVKEEEDVNKLYKPDGSAVTDAEL